VASPYDQNIIDAVAAIHATTGDDAVQGDVRMQVVPMYTNVDSRRTFDMGLDELVPTVLIRGGRPATPTLQLTPRGWLQSARRGDVATMVTVFLATYRSMATAGQLHGRRITWADLQNNGAADALRGVLNTAGRQFHLFAGATLVPPTAAPDQIGLELPWDVDELIHIENADRFFDYRLANPVERVNFFQRLRLRVTGDLKSVIDLVYGANIPGWPLQRRCCIGRRLAAGRGLAQGAEGHAAQFRPPQPAPPSGEPRIQPRIRSPKTEAVFLLPRRCQVAHNHTARSGIDRHQPGESTCKRSPMLRLDWV
jgi:hypothetical protein